MANARHGEQIKYLKKIEGQVRGIQKMIESNRYCVDILLQLHSITGAIKRVENNILKSHVEGCVTSSLKGKSEKDKQKKIVELISLMDQLRNI